MTQTLAMIGATSSTLWFKVIVVIAFLVTVKIQVGFLPRQNVLTIIFLIGLAVSAILLVGEETGIPFGPFFYTESLGWRLFYRLPWLMPFLWVAALLNCREVARLILKPWRDAANYGWWVIGLGSMLMVVFDATLEPFATRAGHFWIWETQDIPPWWHGVPLMNFFGVAATSLFILGIVTPWLINKKPGAPAAPNRASLLLWMVLMLFLTAENAVNHFQLAAATGGITVAAIALVGLAGSQK